MSHSTSLTSQLLALEQRVYDPAVRRSPELCAPLFAEEFLEFGSSGKVFDKQSIVAALMDETPFDGVMRVEDFQVIPLANEVVLATYRLDVCNPAGEIVRKSLRSTIYRLIEVRWQQIFHQGTSCPQPWC